MMDLCLLSTRFSSLFSPPIRKIPHFTSTALRIHRGRSSSSFSPDTPSKPSPFSPSLPPCRCFPSSSCRAPLTPSVSTTRRCRFLSLSSLYEEDDARRHTNPSQAAEINLSSHLNRKDYRIFLSSPSPTSSTLSPSSLSVVCKKEEGLASQQMKKKRSEIYISSTPTSTPLYCRRFSSVSDPRQITHPADRDASQQGRCEEGEGGREEDIERSTRLKRLMYRAKQRGWVELDLLLGGYAEKFL
ncbi:tpr repeat region protein, partial [Cystoisospora suis]